MKFRLGFSGEAVRIALRSILAHKLRTFLTLLGIIFGVASVMVVGAGIEGLQSYVMEMVSKQLGSNSFLLSKFANAGKVSQEEWDRMRRRNKDIDFQAYQFVRRTCDACEEVAAELSARRTLRSKGEEILGTEVIGTTVNRIALGSQVVEEGRYFTDEEVRRSRYVCVIGSEVKEKLFPAQDAVGQTLKIGSENFRVIGLLEELGSAFGSSLDNTVHVPITTYQKIYGQRRSLTIRGRAESREEFETAVEQVRMAMRIRHRLAPDEDDTFGIISTDEINSQVDEFTSMIAMVVIPITLISLVVGGIVVMNIMLVSVTERTFEIGLRKSLGARRRDILKQFVIESFFLAASGGIIGLGLAVLVSWIIESTVGMTMTVSLEYVVLAIGVSGGIGIASGIYPALKASRLDPIEALRTER